MFMVLPVYAGQLEDALAKGKPVFLYMYTPECGYCTKFSPRYQKLSHVYDGSYTFVKIDASTYYGYNLMRQLKARYVPYVALIKPKTHYASQIDVNCLADTSCTDKTLNNFKK